MDKISRVIVLLVMFFTVPYVGAAQEDSHGRIKNIYTYVQYGGGDIIVQVSNPSPNCGGGFWLSVEDPGFDSTLSFLLSGYHAQSTFHFSGDNTQIWGGSGAKYCRLTSVGLRQ
jgi:hypothetical protein